MTVPDNEIKNTRNMLDLLRSQVKAGRIETDYMLKQLNKVDKLIERLSESQQSGGAAKRFEALYDVSQMMGTSLDLSTVLNQVMDAVITLTGAESGLLMLRNDDGVLQVEAARNFDQRTLSSEEFNYSRTISGMALDQGEAILTTNAVEDPRFSNQKSVVAQSLRSIMVTPLWARNHIIGIAYVENRAIAGLFSQDDLTTLEALAGQAAIAIDNALLFAETDEALSDRVEELRLLRRIDLQLNQKLDPDEAMHYTLEAACRLTEATTGHLGLVEGDGNNRRLVSIHRCNGTESSVSDKPIYLDDVYPRVWEAIDSAHPITFDTGQYGVHTVLMVPIVHEGKTVGLIVLKREDGEGFSAEQQELVERVTARAAISIENARLYTAVQAADRAKSEFVGIVAHDLKAPMTAIRGYADLMLQMQSDSLTGQQRKFLQRITDTVQRMEILVSDLADISRIESGQFLMDERRVPVLSVVEAVRDTITPEVNRRDHKFIEDIDDNLPDVFTDYYRVIQVLTNLLSNAYKYTPNGGLIKLTVKQHEDRVHFAVADTGIGLSEESVRKMGTKFWRAEDDYTRSQPGTGLGFAITSSLVIQMGSHIQIDSELGKGSTFSFDVAVAKDDD